MLIFWFKLKHNLPEKRKTLMINKVKVIKSHHSDVLIPFQAEKLDSIRKSRYY